MARGILGVDTAAIVTNASVNAARKMLGTNAAYWGRFFKGPNSPVGVQYDSAHENAVLSAANIPVLPIARQTNNVNGTSAQGKIDGANNAAAIIKAFGIQCIAGQGSQFLVFLDVEGADKPRLRNDYFIGWAGALSDTSRKASNDAFEFLPCVYARTDDTTSWNSLKAADAAGTKCYGAWVFRAHSNACPNGVIDYDSQFCEPAMALPFPVMIWQFAIDCPDSGGYDLDQTNPNIGGQSEIIDRLILPPSEA